MILIEKKTNIHYSDILRIFASFAVVCIHVTAEVLTNISSLNTSNWWLSMIINGFSRWCVPIFFMVSGIFLINTDKSTNIKVFLKKRLQKILLPFFAWTIIYIIYYNYKNLSVINLNVLIKWFLEGHSASHLWYLYALVGVYLVTPVISWFIHNTQKKFVDYYLLLCLLGSFILPFIKDLTNINLKFNIPLTDTYVFYFILGYYLHNNFFNIKNLLLIYILGLISTIVLIIATTITSSNAHSLITFFTKNSSPTVLLQSIAVFLLIKNSNINDFIIKSNLGTLIQKLSQVTFGVYLIHILFILILKDVLIGYYKVKVIYFVLVSIPITFILSNISVLVLRKIPIVRRLLT